MAFKKYGKATAFHTYLAKVSAVLQAIFILWALFFEPVYGLFYSMIAVGILETFEEISLIIIHDTWVSDVKSIFCLPKKPTDKDP
jgi:CDP-diacylglycerol--glycerol-3-phosphate 3-phosphatidyltransferase